MNLIAVVSFFTCYVVAAVTGYATCGIGKWADTTCVELAACQHFTKPLEILHRTDVSQHEAFISNVVLPAMCGYILNVPLVCCPNSKPTTPKPPESGKKISCGGILWHKGLSPDGAEAELEEFPWLALLEYETRNGKLFGCGGVLISDRYVLTAAHCLGLSEHKLTGVRLGEHDLRTAQDCIKDPVLPYCSEAAIVVGIEQQIPHERYDFLRGPSDFDPLTYDIAVLKLNSSVVTDVIRPICLPDVQETPSPLVAGKYLSAGWGILFNSIYTQSFLKRIARLKGVDKNYCNYKYGRTLAQDITCALSKSNTTACIADPGGPLMSFNRESRMTVIGIYSPVDSQPCRTTGVPSTFIDVRNYVDWIRSKM